MLKQSDYLLNGGGGGGGRRVMKLSKSDQDRLWQCVLDICVPFERESQMLATLSRSKKQYEVINQKIVNLNSTVVEAEGAARREEDWRIPLRLYLLEQGKWRLLQESITYAQVKNQSLQQTIKEVLSNYTIKGCITHGIWLPMNDDEGEEGGIPIDEATKLLCYLDNFMHVIVVLLPEEREG